MGTNGAESTTRDETSHVTYDVTAVSDDGQRVPLTTRTDYSMAHEIARPRSRDAGRAAVEIRDSATGEHICTYAGGVITQGSPR